MIEAGVLDRSGPEAATSLLERLFDAHQRRLYRLARRLCSSREEAEDLVQEAFLRAAGAASRIPEGASSEEAWLVRVLVNISRDRWRRARIRRSDGPRIRRSDGPRVRRSEGPALEVARGADGPELAVRDPESGYLARLAVQNALSRLTPRRRAVVVMHELEGLDAHEVAAALGVSAVTVRWHLSRARRDLARTLRTDSDV